jgi:hypothetical protein
MDSKSGKKFEQEGGAAVDARNETIQYIITDEDLCELAQRLNMKELQEVLEVVRVDEGSFRKGIDEVERRRYDGEDFKLARKEREADLARAAADSVYFNFDDFLGVPGTPGAVTSDARQEVHEALKDSNEPAEEPDGKRRITDIREVQRQEAQRLWLAVEDGSQTPDVSNPVYEGRFDLKTILLYKHLPKETYLLAAIGVDLPALISAVERFRLERPDVDPKLIVGLCEKLYQGVASRMLHRMVLGDSFTEDNLDRFVRVQLDIMDVHIQGKRRFMDRSEVYKYLGLLLKHVDKKKSAQIAGTEDLYMKFIDSQEFWDILM